MDHLGYKARDIITGFEGTIVGRVTYLTGCEQLLLAPAVDKKGEPREAHWYDIDRIEIITATPVALPRTSNGADRPAPTK